RQRVPSADESKPPDGAQQNYVIAVLGVRTAGRRTAFDDPEDAAEGTGPDKDSGLSDRLRSRLLDAAQLIMKSKRPIYAQDVQYDSLNGAGTLRFMFPRTTAIS